MKRASVFVRFAALLVDVAFLVFVFLLIYVAAGAGYKGGTGVSFREAVRGAGFLPTLGCMVVYCFYFTYLTMHGCQSIGKALLRIRVVRPDGDPISGTRAFFRCVFYVVSAVPFLWGFFLAFLLKRRAVHDILAGTVVVEAD